MREGLSYDDVLLVPRRGVLRSRADADISSTLVGSIRLDVPIVSAPMSSVTGSEMARAMSYAGGIGVLHRDCSIVEQGAMYDAMYDAPVVDTAVSIGLDDGISRTSRLMVNGASIFVLDVAHAHSDAVISFVEQWHWMFSDDDIYLIVGNIATASAARDLAASGADALKVGIGPGAACTTREVTGFGVPQLTAIKDVVEMNTGLPVIADGGIKNSGDIVKALVAGADTVMIGRLLAGADEAPHPGEYFGMASKRVNGHNAPEGVEGPVERTGPVSDTIKTLAWGIRSAVSYAGARNLDELRWNTEFIRISEGSRIETRTRL
jgi:IMP dehydrogenase